MAINQDALDRRADIAAAGDPEPVRTAQGVQGDVNRKVNQKQTGPKPPGEGKPEGQGQQPKQQGAPNPLQGFGNLMQQAYNQRPFKQTDNPFSPIDWAKQYADDAAVTYYAGRNTYQALNSLWDKDVHDSVAHVYGSNDTRARMLRTAMASLPGFEGAPGVLSELYQMSGQQEPGLLQGVQQLEGTPVPHPGETQQQYAEQGLQQAPGVAANVGIAAAMPESTLGKAGLIAGPMLAQMLNDPNNQAGSDLAWTAVMGMLTFGKLPPGAKEALTRALGERWPTIQNALEKVVSRRQSMQRNVIDPHSTHIEDAIKKELEAGGFQGLEQKIRKGGTPGVTQGIARRLPTGEVQVDLRTAEQARKKLLKRFGVTTPQGLIEKIQQEGGVSAKAAKDIISQKNWGRLFDFDLRRVVSGDLPLRDPDVAMKAIEDSGLGDAHQHRTSLNEVLDHVHRGLFADSSSPMQATLRSLAGYSRTTLPIVDGYLGTAAHLLRDVEGVSGEDLTRAIEGDMAHYESLPPQAQMVVDGYRLVSNAIRREHMTVDPERGAVGNYIPRIDKTPPPGGARAGAFAAQAARHREESLIPLDDKLVLGQQFKTIQEANTALRQARDATEGALTDITKALPNNLANDPEAKAIRKLINNGQTEEATVRAKQLAMDRFPPKEVNFFEVAQRTLGRQIKALKTKQALHNLTETDLAVPHPTWKDSQIAVKAAHYPSGQRNAEEMKRQGYEPLDIPGASGYFMHSELAKEITPYIRLVNSAEASPTMLKKLNDIEARAVARIMISPLTHSWNVAGRMMGLATLSPIHTLNMLMDGGKAWQAGKLDEWMQDMRREAWLSGVVTPHKNQTYGDNVQGFMNDALGDIGDHVQKDPPSPGTKQRIGDLLHSPAIPFQAMNNKFWGYVNDFATMAYHIEKSARLNSPLWNGTEEEARLIAARRANSWAGFVAPEDTNPLFQRIAKSIFFAPNWWRTWAELMIPMYKRTGMEDQHAAYEAYRSAKTMAAVAASAYVSGNVMNYMLTSSTPWAHDGHFMWQNEHGNQLKVEATGGWLDTIPGFTALAGPANDPQKGGVRTVENPLARQFTATTTALGLAGGVSGWTPTSMFTGLEKEVAARLSPVVDTASALINIDPYRTAADGQLRAVDQGSRAGVPDAWSVIAAGMYLTPFGTSYSNTVQQAMQKGQYKPGVDPPFGIQLPFGTKIPAPLAGAVGGIKDSMVASAMSWMLGVNPPYEYKAKTTGQTPSDQDYQKSAQYQQQYQQQMSVLSAELTSGQITPQQWQQNYKALSQQHSAEMNAIYQGSPNYVNGAQGLVAEYENLYSQATQPDGSINFDQLDQLQAGFRGKHSSSELASMDSLLKQNDQKYPALKLYHNATTGYRNWQTQYAYQSGVSLSKLHHELNTYSNVYNDPVARKEWQASDPEGLRIVRAYERAKVKDFYSTQDGVLYSLFYGGSRTSAAYLQRTGLTQDQLLAELEQQMTDTGQLVPKNPAIAPTPQAPAA